MTEIWRPIVRYEGQYQVSSFGNVKSLNICRLIKYKFWKHETEN